MSKSTLHGRFIWHELMTTDPRSAGRFFSSVIGWKTQAWPHDPDYRIFMAGRQPVAGLMLLPEPARAMGVPPNWLTYIGTPDVAETTARAESLGAKVLKEATTLPAVGTFAVLEDPQGASFALYTPDADAPTDAPPAIGDFSWHELATTDHASALGFYRALFGWEDAGAADMGEALGMYRMFGRGGRAVGGMFTKPANMAGPAAWLPYIHVADARRAAAAVTRAGASIINGPMQVPGGDWIAQGLDPQGAVFAVHSSRDAAGSTPSKPAAARRVGTAKKASMKTVATARKAAVAGRAAKKPAGRGPRAAKRTTGSTATGSVRAAKKRGRRRSR